MVSEQWFVRDKRFGKKAIDVVENDEIKYIPKAWEKTYFSGCTISKIGAYQDSNGGVIEFLLGMTQKEIIMSQR